MRAAVAVLHALGHRPHPWWGRDAGGDRRPHPVCGPGGRSRIEGGEGVALAAAGEREHGAHRDDHAHAEERLEGRGHRQPAEADPGREHDRPQVGDGHGGDERVDRAAPHPEVLASLTLVCPGPFPAAPLRPLASRLLLVHGDRGPGARVVPRALPDLPGATEVLLRDFPDSLWSDPIAERLADVAPALRVFLAAAAARAAVAPLDPAHADEAGEVAGVTYRIQGSGPPLVLLPLALAAAQWDPLLPALAAGYATVSLGGARLWPVTALEQRARGGYGAVVRALVAEAGPRPGERVLEAGCGPGVILRWLARRTGGANPLVGVDANRYLLREAARLAQGEGVAARIRFQEGDAEALPFPPASFDVALACTVLEEGDADRMLRELVRVTAPGGRVGVVVRATDLRRWSSLPLRPALQAKIAAFPGAGAAAAGCADASLYRRVRAAGLADLRMGPQLGTTHPDPSDTDVECSFVNGPLPWLSPEETREWLTAVAQAEADGSLLWTNPFHCAVGTKR